MIEGRRFLFARALFMLETVLILLFSVALFIYWFRYTVVLLLAEQSAAPGPVSGQLNLRETREALWSERPDLELVRLHRMLHNDYRMLRYLLDHAAGLGLHPLERHLLLLDYRAMAVWYMLTRWASTSQARRALREMAGVLNCIAFKMDARAVGASQA
jgi:hypothetical protein